ncbi:hypothetical protein PAHAL_1G008900 [Panicum hallii]|uniref:Uncharacterized protein n=1 Tax=Panicum hallii TaxID=206008 RepID=A0A2T8KTL5_9POAL|nr:hypothetical protein PAHAL_1G008900 [Panicum hallii]
MQAGGEEFMVLRGHSFVIEFRIGKLMYVSEECKLTNSSYEEQHLCSIYLSSRCLQLTTLVFPLYHPQSRLLLSKAEISFFSEKKRLFFGGTFLAKQVLRVFALMNVRATP